MKPVTRGHLKKCPYMTGVPSSQVHFNVKVYFGSQKMQFRHPNFDILVSPRHRFYCTDKKCKQKYFLNKFVTEIKFSIDLKLCSTNAESAGLYLWCQNHNWPDRPITLNLLHECLYFYVLSRRASAMYAVEKTQNMLFFGSRVIVESLPDSAMASYFYSSMIQGVSK